MKTDRSDYIVYGWKLPPVIKNSNDNEIDLWDDKFLPMIEGRPNEEFTIIRGNDYTVFGLLLNVCDGGWDFETIYPTNLDPEMVKNKYNNLFNNQIEMPDPTLFIFSHYS